MVAPTGRGTIRETRPSSKTRCLRLAACGCGWAPEPRENLEGAREPQAASAEPLDRRSGQSYPSPGEIEMAPVRLPGASSGTNHTLGTRFGGRLATEAV